MIEARVRSRISAPEMQSKVSKILTDRDYNILLTGPTKLYAPNGQPLAVYLPGALSAEMDTAYSVLTTIRALTENRGYASGTGKKFTQNNTQRAKPVMSSILGSFESAGFYKYCRLTSWTAHELEGRWPTLLPLLQSTAEAFKTYVPERYAAQMKWARGTSPDWMVTGTPFTTITVNNTYPTGVHKDAGDLEEGFSCLGVARRGEFTGGYLTFPEYRVAVNMQDGDLLLMDAHSWHGNTQMTCACDKPLHEGPCAECGAERISVVSYFRQKMVKCGSAEEEGEKAVDWAERNYGVRPEEVPAAALPDEPSVPAMESAGNAG